MKVTKPPRPVATLTVRKEGKGINVSVPFVLKRFVPKSYQSSLGIALRPGKYTLDAELVTYLKENYASAFI